MHSDQPISAYVISLFYTLQISVKLGSKLGQKLTTFLNLCTGRIAASNNFFFIHKTVPAIFFIFKYFLNNLLLGVFMQATLPKLPELLQ